MSEGEKIVTVDGKKGIFREIHHVYDGQSVWAPFWRLCPTEDVMEAREKRIAVRCKVAVAAGLSVRVTNEKLKLDRWLPISDLKQFFPLEGIQ